MEKILFINGSPNRDGNTAALAKVLLEGREYETLNLNDYRLNFYGQTLEGDQLDELIAKMKHADIIVMGSRSIGTTFVLLCVPLWNVSMAMYPPESSKANDCSSFIREQLLQR